jgi:hypothetical protein
MIIHALRDLMINKYDNYRIYIHNLANFDAIFILKILAQLAICKPIIHHDKIIFIQCNYKGYVIHFRDSQQLLLTSLLKLGKSFNVETLKSVFPYSFVNEYNLNYIGDVPSINFFNLSINDYNKYKNEFINKT